MAEGEPESGKAAEPPQPSEIFPQANDQTPSTFDRRSCVRAGIKELRVEDGWE